MSSWLVAIGQRIINYLQRQQSRAEKAAVFAESFILTFIFVLIHDNNSIMQVVPLLPTFIFIKFVIKYENMG